MVFAPGSALPSPPSTYVPVLQTARSQSSIVEEAPDEPFPECEEAVLSALLPLVAITIIVTTASATMAAATDTQITTVFEVPDDTSVGKYPTGACGSPQGWC